MQEHLSLTLDSRINLGGIFAIPSEHRNETGMILKKCSCTLQFSKEENQLDSVIETQGELDIVLESLNCK